MPENPDSFKLRPVGALHWRKVSGADLDATAARAGETLTAIVKVREPGYVPRGVSRREAISETLFTAELERRRLPELEADPLVESVELSRPLHRD